MLLSPHPDMLESQQKPDMQADVAKAKQFAKEFLEQLQKTKDVSLLVDKYFASNPTRFFPYSFEGLIGNPELLINLSNKDRDRIGIEFFNFTYTMGLFVSKGAIEDDQSVARRFPPHVMEAVKSSPVLSPLLNEGIELKFDTLHQLNSFIEALRPINISMRNYLNAHPEEWKSSYEKMKLQLSTTKDSKGRCKGEHCFGLPDETEVFAIGEFPFYFSIVKEGTRFRILAIDALMI
jgi:hypothetical protein